MRTKIFYEDLNQDTQSRVQWALCYDLKDEIKEVVENMADPETAESEVIDDYMQPEQHRLRVRDRTKEPIKGSFLFTVLSFRFCIRSAVAISDVFNFKNSEATIDKLH